MSRHSYRKTKMKLGETTQNQLLLIIVVKQLRSLRRDPNSCVLALEKRLMRGYRQAPDPGEKLHFMLMQSAMFLGMEVVPLDAIKPFGSI